MLLKKHILMEETSLGSTTSGGTGSSTPTAPAAPTAAPVADSKPAAPPSADNAAGEEPAVDWLEESKPDTDEGPAEGAQPGTKPAVAEAKPAVAAAQTPKAEVTPEVKPVEAQPVNQPAAIAKPAEEPKSAAAMQETPEAKATREKAEAEQEKQLFDGLVEYYKIPDEMAVQLTTEPERVLPVMAARVHQAVVRGMQQMMAYQLPQYLTAHRQVMEKESAAKGAFYKAWPGLAEHEQQVLQVGQMFRQANPNATPEIFIQTVGKIVSDALGISIAPAGGAAPAPTASAVAASAAAPIVPAGHSGARAAASPKPTNEFEALAMDED